MIRAALPPFLLVAASLIACDGPAPVLDGVLLVIIDTARADRCSFIDPGTGTTPRLEALAADSWVFRDCWSQTSWTAPSVAGMFTGLPPGAHGVTRNGSPLAPGVETVASRLADRGFATGLFACNGIISHLFGLDRGFDVAWAAPPSEDAATPASAAIMRALPFIDGARRAGRPFFCAVSLMEPHAPHEASPGSLARFRPADVTDAALRRAARLYAEPGILASLGLTAPDPEALRALRVVYDAEIHDADLAIGGLLDELRSRGLLDRMLVVVCGDHGEGLGDHGWIEHGSRLDRSLLRVPLLVRPPGGVRSGRQVRDVVRLDSVAATILAAAGVPADDPAMAPDLLARTEPETAIATEEPHRPWIARLAVSRPGVDVRAISRRRASARWKRWHVVVDDAGGEYVFDVAADPDELRNLADSHPEILAQGWDRIGGALQR